MKALKLLKVLVYCCTGLVAFLGVLLGVRQLLAPREGVVPEVSLTPAEAARVRALAGASRVGLDALVEDVRRVDVLLLGEEHFKNETVRFATDLLDRLPERRVSLLLELPARAQRHLDRYLASGEPAELDAVWNEGDALPYRPLVVWARENRERVSRLVAMDEDSSRIFLNRAFLRDTRNATMCGFVLDALRERPGELVVAYGGQMHMLLSGRYRYDVENRTPAGARLLSAGLPRSRVRTVLLSGKGKAPVSDVTEPGIVNARLAAGEEPWQLFVSDAVFRAESGRDLFDYFVNLGELTRVASAD